VLAPASVKLVVLSCFSFKKYYSGGDTPNPRYREGATPSRTLPQHGPPLNMGCMATGLLSLLNTSLTNQLAVKSRTGQLADYSELADSAFFKSRMSRYLYTKHKRYPIDYLRFAMV